MDINEIGVESSTASRTEHKKDTANAPNRYNNIMVINVNV
jgi:hypothetical protein